MCYLDVTYMGIGYKGNNNTFYDEKEDIINEGMTTNLIEEQNKVFPIKTFERIIKKEVNI